MWVWIGVAVVVVAFLGIFVASLCKVSSEADAALERFRREGHI